MNEFMSKVVLSNPVRDYIVVAAVIVVAYGLKRTVGKYASRVFFYAMKQIGREIDRQEFNRLVMGPVEKFIFLLITYVALVNLRFPELLFIKFMKTDTRRVTDMIGTSIVILSFSLVFPLMSLDFLFLR